MPVAAYLQTCDILGKMEKKKIHFFRPLLVEFLLFAAKCIPDSVPICAHNTACCE